MDKGQFLLYQTPDGESQIEVKLQDDTVWLSLDQMAELFQRNKSTISRHIRNVLEDGELDANSVIANFATTASDGIGILDDFLKISRKDILTHAGKSPRNWLRRKLTKSMTSLRKEPRMTCHLSRFTSLRTLNESKKEYKEAIRIQGRRSRMSHNFFFQIITFSQIIF